MSEPTPTSPVHWRRAIRPLIWWGLMVLLMFAYRTHEKLSAKTHLNFKLTLTGNPADYETRAVFDGKTVSSGQRIPIGWHALTLTHPKAKPFSTNLFIWYGERNLGMVELERAIGVLSISAVPAAKSIAIRGAEFSMTLTNTPGITSSVPTDRYVIEVAYQYWQHQEEIAVNADQTSPLALAPRLGILSLEANYLDVTYLLHDDKGQQVDAGTLPATLTNLPHGSYQLTARRKRDRRDLPVTVNAHTTNTARVEFTYGIAMIDSDPPGALVRSGKNEWGVTPLTLPEVRPDAFYFVLQKDEFETVAGMLMITANQTNIFRTNLVSRYYTMAMEKARRSYGQEDFDRAAKQALEALKHKPDDLAAKNLERDATGHAHLSRGEALAQRGHYADAIKEVNLGLTLLPENAEAKALFNDYTNREQQRIEVEKKRKAELAEEQKKQREKELAEQQARQRISQINEVFNTLSRGYENTAAFSQHELTATNLVGPVGAEINNAFENKQPSFRVVRFNWPRPDTFILQGRQSIGVGYRECLIVGGQVREKETRILFKVFEYEHPPDLNLLGGLLKLTGDIKITSQDPNVARDKAEKFQVRAKEGVEMVSRRIQSAFTQIH